MPGKSITETYDAWPGAQMTLTYNNRGLITSATLWVPNGCTGEITVTVQDVPLQASFVAPAPELGVTPSPAGGQVETLHSVTGMRWSYPVNPAWDPGADGNGWSWGASYTAQTLLPQTRK